MMKVVGIAIEEFGRKVFKCLEEPFPEPKHDEVVIRVLATCVNKMDLWRTHTECELPPHWNPVPGLECVGTIIELGKYVHDWKLGDQVCALLDGGGYAEAVVVRATQVLPLPLGKTFVYPLSLDKTFMYGVASLPRAACTAWEAISRLGKLSADMTLLVYERCGRICDLAIQLAEMVQASVIVARDESTFIKNFSHPTFDVKSPHFISDVIEATEGKLGVDVILDCHVSTIRQRSALRRGGRIVLVDLGPQKVSTADLYFMCCVDTILHVVDSMWWTPESMAAVVADMKKNMWPAFSNGSLVLPKVVEQKSYSLSHAALAKCGDILTPALSN